MIGDRTYRVFSPPEAGRGAIMFFHGVGGTASQYADRRDVQALASEFRIHFVATQSAEDEWNIPGAPADYPVGATNEFDYAQEVAADIKKRFGVDHETLLIAGFSSGAMVVSTLACASGESVAAGYAPMSGTMWAPLPSACPGGPVSLIHYHGLADGTVPMEGRTVYNSRQGDVHAAHDLFAATSNYGPTKKRTTTTLNCEARSDSADRVLELCLFEGGHVFNADRLRDAWSAMNLQRGDRDE
ncbi:MAG: hypothetical protein AAF311_09575 [Pseudomonadota bacterium]